MSPPSPDSNSYTTPPSSPFPLHPGQSSIISESSSDALKPIPRLVRRPSTLQIQNESVLWAGDVVAHQSPDGISQQPAVLADHSRSHLRHSNNNLQALKSPCFVHSHLDKGASLQDWLRQSRYSNNNSKPSSLATSMTTSSQGSQPDDDEEEYGGSLTRQLAETAVGVREMSKQLGRARVRSNIQNVLIITKARDNRLIKLTRELALYLMTKPQDNGRGLVVYVDAQLRHSKRFDAPGIEAEHPELFRPSPRRRSSNSSIVSATSETSGNNGYPKEDGQLRYWTSDMCNRSPHLFDFVVTLGGDGTVLFTSWLFQRIVPPVLPFALGSLGFLTNFDFSDYQAVMDSAIENGIRVNLRMRFTCTVYRAVAAEEGKGRKAMKKGETGEIMMKNIEKGGWEALESGPYAGTGAFASNHKDKEIKCFTTRPVVSFEVLNDLVVDRGPSPYVSLLELFGDEHHMTTVQADGLTVSTPTGSTAYSLSAGGSLVHPEIPALLITPICPHTLSFRPMLLPDTMELRICVPYNSRSTAWASFDGRGRVELKQGDHIKVTASKYPFPTVCADKQSTDWFHAIARTLKWNERERQKSFVVVEEGPAKPRGKKQKPPTDHPDKVQTPTSARPNHHHIVPELENEEEDEEEDEDEEEEKYDIDDSSPEAAAAAAASTVHSESNSPPAESPSYRRDSASESASQLSDHNSGIDTPDRFGGPHPHPPKTHPRHTIAEDSSQESGYQHVVAEMDHGKVQSHSPILPKHKFPSQKDFESESIKTPRAHESTHHHHHHRPTPQLSILKGHRTPPTAHSHPHQHYDRMHHQTRSVDLSAGVRRAFAVVGHDESDSNASDSGE